MMDQRKCDRLKILLRHNALDESKLLDIMAQQHNVSAVLHYDHMTD